MPTKEYRLKVTLGSLHAPLQVRVSELGGIPQSEYIRELIKRDLEFNQLSKDDFSKKEQKG